MGILFKRPIFKDPHCECESKVFCIFMHFFLINGMYSVDTMGSSDLILYKKYIMYTV